MAKKKVDERLLMMVTYNDTDGKYSVSLGKGSNVNETAFVTMVVIKCLVKDGMINSAKEFTDLLDKYLNDPQYEEIKDEQQN